MKKAVIIMLCLCMLLTACAGRNRRRGSETYDESYTEIDGGDDKKDKKEAEFIDGGLHGKNLNIYEAYKAALEKLREDGASGGYTLYDIDDDGVPELIARISASGGDTTVYIYYMSASGAEKIDVWPERTDIVPLGAENAILLHRSVDGEESIFKVKFSGGTCEVSAVADGWKIEKGEEPVGFETLALTDIGSESGLDWLENPKDENDKLLKEFLMSKPKPQEVNVHAEWKVDYRGALSELGTEEFFGYALYDLDCDGVPEMLMQTYSVSSGISTYIVDFENGERTVTEVYAGSGVIAGYYDESTVVFQITGNGEESISVLNYKGGYATTIEIVSRTLKYGEHYLVLEPLTLYGVGDMAGLEWTKNPVDHNKSIVEALG